MFDQGQYISTLLPVRLSDLQTAIEYSAVAEYNTHVISLRSGIFMVTTEAAAIREAEFGGLLIAIRGEKECTADSSSTGSASGGAGVGSPIFTIAARAGR